MKHISVLTILLLILQTHLLYCQTWDKVYFSNQASNPHSVIESYDKGYVIAGEFNKINGTPIRGYVLKTNINGGLLWYKTIGISSEYSSVSEINLSNDNGLILTGMTGKEAPYYNPFIMKLNSCGENEWCRIYSSHESQWQSWGQSIHPVPGGYIALIWGYGHDIQKDRIWLFRLDEGGDLLWTQYYAQSDTLIDNEESATMIVTTDSHYLITGYCYYPDPNDPLYVFLRPFLIKVDSTGTPEWELPWRSVMGESYVGQSYKSITDNAGTIYSSGRHIVTGGSNQGDKPAIIKTDKDGNELSYKDLIPGSVLGVTGTINWFADSTIVLGEGWLNTYPGDEYVGVVKVDRFGNIIKSKQLFLSPSIFNSAATTFDNKIVMVASIPTTRLITHAYKFNSDLEYDSIYTRPFVYDSLCTHTIPSDTIDLDCVVVDVEEHFNQTEENNLKVYPNPASSEIQIEIPEKIILHSKTISFNVTTVHYQIRQVRLEIYDLFGKTMLVKELQPSEKKLEINVSTWPKGMYIIRLVYNNETIAGRKILVQ